MSHTNTTSERQDSLLDSTNVPDAEAPRSKLPIHSPSALKTGWEVVLARIVGVAGSGEIIVEFPRPNPVAMTARTVISVGDQDVGQQAIVAFEDGDLAKPIILGLIMTPEKTRKKTTISADGDKFVVLAEREIELRCGEASITLTRAGKVLIKGEYILTRAKGVNRIKGAAVSIN